MNSAGIPLAERPVTALRGVGPALAELLAKLGLHSVQDVLFHLPTRYEDRTRVVPIGSLRNGDRAVIEGDVENGSLMAGQSVGMVTREQPTLEILNELVAQAVGALARRNGFADKPDHGAGYRAEIVSGAAE